MREYWSYCGEIEEVDLMRFPDTGRFKGIAFVTFAEVGQIQALAREQQSRPGLTHSLSYL